MAIISNRPHMVINSDRTITVPDMLKNLAMQFDHNMESITFDCPRYWDDYDLSTLDVYINYEAPDGKRGSHECTNISIDENNETIIHFEWTILSPVTMIPGNIKFLVCGKKINDKYELERRWHTQPCTDCSIMVGMDCMDTADNHVIVPDNYNVDAKFEALFTEINNIKGIFAMYDSDNDGTVNNAESVNGIIFGKDDKGIYIES